MAVFKCKMCGGNLEIQPNSSIALCECCGSQQTIPMHLDDDERLALYDRANHYRRNSEFDKAIAIYEQILNKDKNDAEAYWSLVLCKYGITYVEDPKTHKRVPTVNRAQYTSIFDDENFKSAYKLADSSQRKILEMEARTINTIQKGIIAISEKEEPFDVFICYKETDNNGRRTKDSVLANELYHELTNEGLKVFFSRITLEDKLGVEYEPYIFAALHSAKVMVVIGTNKDFFNAVWVKNEWSRFLSLIKSGEKKVLIPAYKDMDPYDLPQEFSHLQAQDMNKLGFVQDLIRGIKKITNVGENQSKASAQNINADSLVQSTNLTQVQSFLKRGFMFLEDVETFLQKNGTNWKHEINEHYYKEKTEFKLADEYFDKALDIDPECSQAYLGKFLVEKGIPKTKYLSNLFLEDIKDNVLFEKAEKFAGEKEKINYAQLREKIKENTYLTPISNIEKSSDFYIIWSEIKFLESISLEYKNKDIDRKILSAKQKINDLLIRKMNDLLKRKQEFDDAYRKDVRNTLAFVPECGSNNNEVKRLTSELKKKQDKIAVQVMRKNDYDKISERLKIEKDYFSSLKSNKTSLSIILFVFSLILGFIAAIIYGVRGQTWGIAMIVVGINCFIIACPLWIKKRQRQNKENEIKLKEFNIYLRKNSSYSITEYASSEKRLKSLINDLAKTHKNISSIINNPKIIEMLYNDRIAHDAVSCIYFKETLHRYNTSLNQCFFMREMLNKMQNGRLEYMTFFNYYYGEERLYKELEPYLSNIDVMLVYEIYYIEWLYKLEQITSPRKRIAKIEKYLQNLGETIKNEDMLLNGTTC